MPKQNTQLELVFKATTGKDAMITILNPKDGLTGDIVRAVADKILKANIFKTKQGELTAYKEARLRVLNVTTL